MSAMASGIYDFPTRNRLAVETIEWYAEKHAIADAALGLIGFVPIPGAAALAVGAALSLQVPMYQALARDLSNIYMAPHDDVSKGIIRRGMKLDVGLSIADFLVDQLGMAFLKEISPELLSESGIGLAASFFPVFGGFIGIGLDVALAATMTWRVGVMVSMYFQNGKQWLDGSRHETYEASKEETGGLSPTIKDRANLNTIPSKHKQPRQYQAKELATWIRSLRRMRFDITDDEIRKDLRNQGVPDQVIEDSLLYAND
jgi:hypothetical protein